MGFFCKQPKCISVKVDGKVSVSLQNIYVDLREQFLCISVAVQIPLSAAKLGGNPAIMCAGVTCKDCGEGYALPKCCCGCEAQEPAITRMDDLCCRSAYLCCVLGYKCSDCCTVKGKGYATLGDGMPCKFLAQGNFCCYNGFVNCPCDAQQVPVACAYLGWQCYPTCACHCCAIKCCGTMPGTPTPPESASIIRKGEVASPDAAVPLVMARNSEEVEEVEEVYEEYAEDASSVPATPMVSKNVAPEGKRSQGSQQPLPPPVPADDFAGTLVNGVVCFICPTGQNTSTDPSSGNSSVSGQGKRKDPPRRK